MAKFECIIPNTYDFDVALKYFRDCIVGSSFTAELEDSSDYRSGSLRVAVRVFETYSLVKDNRLSLTVTLVSEGAEIFASGIASGAGTRFAKHGPSWAEIKFLDEFIKAALQFEGMTQIKPPATST